MLGSRNVNQPTWIGMQISYQTWLKISSPCLLTFMTSSRVKMWKRTSGVAQNHHRICIAVFRMDTMKRFGKFIPKFLSSLRKTTFLRTTTASKFVPRKRSSHRWRSSERKIIISGWECSFSFSLFAKSNSCLQPALNCSSSSSLQRNTKS